jgi:hypothetical protein
MVRRGKAINQLISFGSMESLTTELNSFMIYIGNTISMRINISLISLITIMVVIALVIPVSIASAEENKSPLSSLFKDPTLSIKYDRINFSHDAESEWGIDTADYYAIDLVFRWGPEFYAGWELGYTKDNDLVNDDGDIIDEFEYLSFTAHGKGSLKLCDGISFDLGGGLGFFWIVAEEEKDNGRDTVRYNDHGYAAEALTEFNWRTDWLLIGLDAKYQFAFSCNPHCINYSNYRYGGHVGIIF